VPKVEPSRSESTLGSALLARFELCGPAFVDELSKLEDPRLEEPKLEEPKLEDPRLEEPKLEEPKLEEPKLEDPPTAELPAPYGVPMVFERSCSVPAVLDPSRSESTLGSALLRRSELCGPAVVDEVLYDEPPMAEEPVFEVLDPSRSESILGSILFARLVSCGPALVEVEVFEPVCTLGSRVCAV
jgi:prolactin regulatory element-binding protein